MTGRRRFYLAVVGWLSIVAVGSTLVWTVVAQAGRDVGEPERDTLAASSGSSATEPPVSATATVTPTATATATGSAGETPSETASGTPSGTATESATETAGPPASTPPAETHRRTWQGVAGRVIASCTGAKISLVAAQPNNGWRVEVDDRGPQELSVKFELTEEDEDDRIAARSVTGEVFDEVEVHARCVDGVPSFSADR